MTELALSVVVPTRNRAAMLGDLLTSLAAQTFPHDLWELILVDDGSTDETANVIERFAKNARIRIALIRQRNAGAGAARNAGAAAARGKRLLFLDDDMIAAEMLVAEHARYADDARTSVMGCITVPPSRRNPWTAWEDSQLTKLARELAAGRLPGPRDFNSGNCSVPSALFHAVGGFGAALARGEDFQLGYRLAAQGSVFAFLPKALSTHLGSHPYDAWARNAEAFGRSEVALQEKTAPGALVEEAAGWYRDRNVLNRVVVRLLSCNAALCRPIAAGIGAVGSAAYRLGARAVANAAYSAVYNIFYWHGVIDSVGPDRFWPAVRKRSEDDFDRRSPKPGQPYRLAHIEYMRGLAALAVMWFHFTVANDDCPPGLVKSSGEYGYLGVDVFFVISGFIIPYAMAARGYRLRADGLKFFLARVVRIEPPYLASVALCVALPYVAHLTPWSRGFLPFIDLRDVLLQPAYLVPWVKGAEWLNASYWTLAIEFQYYILMLFTVSALIARSQWSARLFLLATFAGAFFLGDDSRLVFCYLPLFGFGFAAFLWFEGRLHRIEIVLWTVAFATLCSRTVGPDDMASGLLAAALILAPWPKEVRLLSLAGAISYSLYLIHNPIGGRVFTLVERLPARPLIEFAGVGIAVAASLLAACVFYLVAEAPSVRAARRIK